MVGGVVFIVVRVFFCFDAMSLSFKGLILVKHTTYVCIYMYVLPNTLPSALSYVVKVKAKGSQRRLSQTLS